MNLLFAGAMYSPAASINTTYVQISQKNCKKVQEVATRCCTQGVPAAGIYVQYCTTNTVQPQCKKSGEASTVITLTSCCGHLVTSCYLATPLTKFAGSLIVLINKVLMVCCYCYFYRMRVFSGLPKTRTHSARPTDICSI